MLIGDRTKMGKTRFSVTTAGGDALEVESDMELGEIIDELRAQGYAFGSNLSVQGKPVKADYKPVDGDEIETHDTPAGN